MALRRRNTGTMGGKLDMNSLRAAGDICATAVASSGGDIGGPAPSAGDGCWSDSGNSTSSLTLHASCER